MSTQSTATGWTPWPGALVEAQMYEPTRPSWNATLAERITCGVRHGEPRLMRLKSTWVDEDDGYIHWHLVVVATGKASWLDDNYAILTDASDQEAQPDLISLLGMTPRTEA